MAQKAERIREMPLEQIMGEWFGRYSEYVIQERALPDIQDDSKPAQRRILYAMYLDNNTFDKPFRETAKVVSNIMGNFHPHGDGSIYGALVHLSQGWKMRELLIEMHGNNGSMDGDDSAAMCHIESRLGRISNRLSADIDKDTANMVLDFDGAEYEPTILPAQFPNLLVNGATDISAGCAIEIPPHNLAEIIDATIHLLKHSNASLADLTQFVKGPDFPTGAIVLGDKGIKEAYESGRGRTQMRAKTSIQDIEAGRQQTVVTETPFGVGEAFLVKKIGEIRLNKEIDGISEARDKANRHSLSAVAELKKGADSQNILDYLFKSTDLQVSYSFNMVAVDHMTPVQIGLKQILSSYLEHDADVITKQTKCDLSRAKTRLETIEGLIHALDILDDVIKIIRVSKSKADAKNNVVGKFNFIPKQAETIISLQLYRLTNIDVNTLRAEKSDLEEKIASYDLLLTDRRVLEKQIIKELNAVKKEFGNERRTKISSKTAKVEIDEKALAAEEDVRVLVSRDGYLKRSSLRSFQSTNDSENGLPDFDKVVFEKTMSTLTNLHIFTNKGNVILRPVHEFVEARWRKPGRHLSQKLGLDADEQIIAVFELAKLDSRLNFLLATNDGYIKQLVLTDIQPTRTYKSRAMIAMGLKETASHVVRAEMISPDTKKEITLSINHAYTVRYDVNEIPTSGARAASIRNINLKGDDFIVDYVTVLPEYLGIMKLGVVIQGGAFEELKYELINKISRAERGVLVLHELEENPHRATGVVLSAQNRELLVETSSARTMTIKTNDFPLRDRYSDGPLVIDPIRDGGPTNLTLGKPTHYSKDDVSKLF